MGIYEPAEDSYLMEKHVREFALGRVLDMGTGSGIQALTAITNPNAQLVLAVDNDEEAVHALQEKIKKEKIRKLKVLQSDLFSNVDGQYNLIIFNPPYLPQDKGVKDQGIYGGKKGWEVAARFFQAASPHLYPDGKILFLFSSLTGKEKIEAILHHHLFIFQEIECQKLPFEILHLYLIGKSQLLRELEKKGVQGIHFFAQGKRGTIYKGRLDATLSIKSHLARKQFLSVAVKAARPLPHAAQRIRNEAAWLQKLNPLHLGARLLFSGEDYFVYEFVEGTPILEWLEQHSREENRQVLMKVLQQASTLDTLGINKEELHHPQKHIIITHSNQPVLLDFERCHSSRKPKNVTQLIEFYCRLQPLLKTKGFTFTPAMLRTLAVSYKQQPGKEQFAALCKAIT